MCERFVEREKSPKRGQANRIFDEISLAEFDKLCRKLDKFNVGGEVVKVDTTRFERVDFESYINRAKVFINS